MQIANRYFKEYLGLLLRRRDRFLELWTGQGDHPEGPRFDSIGFLDSITYFEMLLVQLRAICIERKMVNYTIQNFSHLNKFDIGLEAVDDMLSQVIPYGDPIGDSRMPLRDAIKILTDKFICHYDNLEGGESHVDRNDEEELMKALLPFGHGGRVWWIGDLISLIKNIVVEVERKKNEHL